MEGPGTGAHPLKSHCYLEGLAQGRPLSFQSALRKARAQAAQHPDLRRSLKRWVLVETAVACGAVLGETWLLGDPTTGAVTLLATVSWAGFLWWIFDIHLPLVRPEQGRPSSRFGIPNALTMFRMILVFPMVLFLSRPLSFGDFSVAILFGLWLVGLTDTLDGQLARRFGWTTVFGRDVDPAADIVVTSSTVLALAWAGIFPWWLAGLVALRYLGTFVGFLFLLVWAKTVPIKGTIAGKLTTPSVQILTFVLAYDRLADNPLVSKTVEGYLCGAVGLVIGFNMAYLVWYGLFGQNSPPPKTKPSATN